MQKFKTLTGINIQWPWSDLLVTGKKTIETRTYALSDKLQNVELAVIETPGKKGKKEAGITKARVIGTITFESSFRYKNKKHWSSDFNKHLVQLDDPQFSYNNEKEKWGWVVKSFTKLDKPVAPPSKRGIILAKNCKVPKV